MEVGKTKNSWTLLERVVDPKNGRTVGRFQCKCGYIYVRQISHINTGRSPQCRRCGRRKTTFKKGEKNNSWTFIRLVKPRQYYGSPLTMGKFKCDCGKVRILQAITVKDGRSRHCQSCARRLPRKRRK